MHLRRIVLLPAHAASSLQGKNNQLANETFTVEASESTAGPDGLVPEALAL